MLLFVSTIIEGISFFSLFVFANHFDERLCSNSGCLLQFDFQAQSPHLMGSLSWKNSPRSVSQKNNCGEINLCSCNNPFSLFLQPLSTVLQRTTTGQILVKMTQTLASIRMERWWRWDSHRDRGDLRKPYTQPESR